MDVTPQGYYKWQRNKGKPYKHEALLAQILEILAEDEENSNYGKMRIYLALKNNKGYSGSYSTVFRICRAKNIKVEVKRKSNGITKTDRDAQKSENLIKQDFSAETPNTKWLGDITEIPTADGKLYLSAVLDCFDGAIVGMAMADNMRAELCSDAFVNACTRYGARNMIFHSDRGSQYTSGLYRESLAKYGAVQSMSGTGRCYDNARMESFFATLKKDKLYKIRTEQLPMTVVKSIIFRYIEGYYNHRRIYTTNGGYQPLVWRKMYYSAIPITA